MQGDAYASHGHEGVMEQEHGAPSPRGTAGAKRGVQGGGEHWSGGWVEAKIGEPFRNGNQMSRSKGSKFSTAPSFVASV